MTTAVKVLLRIVVVLLIMAAIACVVLYFTMRVEDQKQVYASYSDVYKSDELKSLNEKVQANGASNKFLTYGNTVDVNYKSINACYLAQLTIFSDLFTNTYYVKDSDNDSRKVINQKLAQLKATAVEASTYADIFERTQTAYGAEGNIAGNPKYEELRGIFRVFEAKYLAHTNLMCEVNFDVFNFVKKYTLKNSSDYSLKYQLMDILCSQCKQMASVADNMTEYGKYFAAVEKFANKYATEKAANFLNSSNVSNNAFKFLKSYSVLSEKIKSDFICSSDKTEYYKNADITTLEKQNLGIVYDYFGISKGA